MLQGCRIFYETLFRLLDEFWLHTLPLKLLLNRSRGRQNRGPSWISTVIEVGGNKSLPALAFIEVPTFETNNQNRNCLCWFPNSPAKSFDSPRAVWREYLPTKSCMRKSLKNLWKQFVAERALVAATWEKVGKYRTRATAPWKSSFRNHVPDTPSYLLGIPSSGSNFLATPVV